MNPTRPPLSEIFTPEVMTGQPRQSLDEIFNKKPILPTTPPPAENPNDFLKIKANPNATFNDNSGIKDVLETPLKSTANLATFPLRVAKTTGEALESGKQLVKEQGLKAPLLASEGALDVGGHMAEKGFEVLSSIGNTFLGALTAGVKKATGVDVGTPEAKKAIETVTKHLMDNKLADATTVVSAIHKMVTENPEQVMLMAQQINKIAGKDLVSETAQKFGSNQIQAGVDKVIDTAGDVVSGAGRALKGTAEKIYEHAITPDTGEAEDLLNYRSKKPFLERVHDTLTGEANPPQTRASTALKEGIAGTEGHIGTQARSLKNSIWKNDVAPALDKSKAVMSKEELFSPIEQRIADTVEPAKRMAYQDAYEAIKDEYKDINNIPIKDVQDIKSTLDKFTPEKIWRGKPVANEYNVLRADMANAARDKIYAALGPGVQQSYADWSNLNDLEQVGVKAISNAGFKGGAGTMVAHLWDAATVPIKTIGGQVLYKVGNAFEFLGENGIKKFGDFLADKGFAPPLALQNPDTNTDTPNNSPSNNEVNHEGIVSQVENKVKDYIKHPKLGNAIEDVSGEEPTLNIAGQNLTLKDVHSAKGTELFKTLSPEDQAKFSEFDQTQSRAGAMGTDLGRFGDTKIEPSDNVRSLSDPENLRSNINKLQPFDVKKAIESGDIPRSEVYGSPVDPTNPELLNPKYAVSLAGQISERLNLFEDGLGSKFLQGLNAYKMTESTLLNKANSMIDTISQSVKSGTQMGIDLKAFHQEINSILKDTYVDDIGVLKQGGNVISSMVKKKMTPLHTEGNKIISDGKPIKLKGAVSDYFRYGYNNSANNGLETEFKKLETLKKAGANTVGLYLSDLPKLKENIGELDKYVKYTQDNGMYVYFAPVGHSFGEGNSTLPKSKDLTNLTEMLASRYGKNPNVIFQLAAEPDIEDWETKQAELAKIVRKYTDNPIIVSNKGYSDYKKLPILDEKNIIYQTGGYGGQSDTKPSTMPNRIGYIADKRNLSKDVPTLLGEFGGNSQRDFSSKADLAKIKDILEEAKKKDISFTSYRIGPNFENDPLSLFDSKGNLTERGKLMINYLK